MGVRVEVSSSRWLAIGLGTVLFITAFIPILLLGSSPNCIVQESSDNLSGPQGPMVVADDSSLLNFSTYLGGYSDEEEASVDCDAAGNIYVAGTTYSHNFPLVNPLDDTIEGSFREGFLTKISPTGEIVYSSYIGGDSDDQIHDIYVDDAGFVYLTGETNSDNFPIVNALDSTLNGQDCFVSKINQAGTAFVFSTFIGGSDVETGVSICVSKQGQVCIGGETYSSTDPDGSIDCFVAKLSSGGNALVYSIVVGGSDLEDVNGMAVDAEGSMYVTGETYSADFPTLNAFVSEKNGLSDAFLLKLNPSGTLNYSTFFGGSGGETGYAIGVDSLGRTYITGQTNSANFPLIRSIDSTLSGGADGFITVFNPDGLSLNFSTFFGGGGYERGTDLVVSSVGSVFVCGTGNSNVPYIIGSSYDSSFNGGSDALLMRLDIDRGLSLLGSYLGGSNLDEATSMSVGNDGTMFVCGWTFSSDFPMRNPVDSTYDSGGFNGYDAFVSAIIDNSDWDFDGIPDKEEAELGTDSLNPDTDFDLLGDYLEVYQLGTNPLTNCTFGNGTLDGDLDHDGDMLTNVEELYEYNTNLLNWDSDLDLLGDGFEIHVVGSLPLEFDSDFDLLSDWEEYMVYNTDCLAPDSDLDSMEDYYEVHNGLNPLLDDASDDEDGDLLTNHQEYLMGTSPNNTDSDFDIMPDYWEYINGLDPLEDDSLLDYDVDQLSNLAEFQNGCDPRNRDCDQDSLDDGYEILVLGTNPLSNDSDIDSMPDLWEVEYGLDPLFDDSSQDLDADDLTNLEEYQVGTRPDMADTDLDSYSDAWEVRNGFDPTNSNVPLVQTIFANLHFVIAGIGIQLVAIPVLYRRVRQKRMKINQEMEEYQDRVSMEFKELLDSINDSIDSDD